MAWKQSDKLVVTQEGSQYCVTCSVLAGSKFSQEILFGMLKAMHAHEPAHHTASQEPCWDQTGVSMEPSAV